LASCTFRGLRILAPFHEAPIQDDLNGRVAFERSLEKAVKVLPIGCDDDELS
jgi:hypothetical protein